MARARWIVAATTAIAAASVVAATWGVRSGAFSGAGNALSDTRASEDRGRYLVKVAGCNDCHTPGYAQRAGQVPESQWLVGDAVGWQGPWGTTYPANLRRLVQSVSAEQWLELARRPTRPPMPWFALRDMTDDDLTAIYYYIRALGPAGANAPAYVPSGQPVHTPFIEFVPRTRAKQKVVNR